MPARRFVPAAFAALLLLAGCGLLPDDEGISASDLAALRAARDRWDDTGANDYRFDVQLHQGLVLRRPVRVTVLDGEVVDIQDLDTGEPVPDPQSFAAFDTVDELLAEAEGAILRAPAGFSGSYDGQLGYPRVVAVDPSRRAVDEEWGFQVESFSLLMTAH